MSEFYFYSCSISEVSIEKIVRQESRFGEAMSSSRKRYVLPVPGTRPLHNKHKQPPTVIFRYVMA